MSKILDNIFEMVSDFNSNNRRSLPIRKQGQRIRNQTSEKSKSQVQITSSVLDDLRSRKVSQNAVEKTSKNRDELAEILKQRYKKRGIFISYDSSGVFALKRVVCKVVEDLKYLGFQDDIWFDKDEGKPNSFASFTQRMESAEDCNAVVMFVSRDCFHSSPMKYEVGIFRRRYDEITSSGNKFRVFVVKFSDDEEIPTSFQDVDVDLVEYSLNVVSADEKAAKVVGALSVQLEGYVTFSTKLYRELYQDTEKHGTRHEGYQNKAVYLWDIEDVQDWLGSLRIHERYCISFEENAIDGYLLMALDDSDLFESLNVDSSTTRQKVLNSLARTLEKETSWDKCCFKRAKRNDCVYVVCDMIDEWIADFIKSDLAKVGISAHFHAKGFTLSNSSVRHLAEASSVIFLMTSSSDGSHVVFKELLLAAWLNKQIVSAVIDFTNNSSLRHAVMAVVEKEPAIMFERQQFLDGLDVLRYHVTYRRGVLPRVKLQQNYVEKMREAMKPFEVLTDTQKEFPSLAYKRPQVFLSYHLHMQHMVRKIRDFLDKNGCETRTDAIKPLVTTLHTRYQNGQTLRDVSQPIPLTVQDGIAKASMVLLCISLKYLHCDNFIKDTKLAELHGKPILPVMLQWIPRPLDRIAAVTKRLAVTSVVIDMSNELQFRRNKSKLLEYIMKTTNS